MMNNKLNNNKGFALILSLLIMAAMTAIGLAAVTTATTDMMIAKNEYEAKKAFYLAEAGIVEALTRMDQPQFLDDGVTTNPRYIGENDAEKTARNNNYSDALDTTLVEGALLSLTTTFWGDGTNFGSGVVGGSDIDTFVNDIGGNYEVVVEYAVEGDDQFVYTTVNTSDGGLAVTTRSAADQPKGMIRYCAPYIANKENLYPTCAKALPVYKISSTGKTEKNTSVTVVNYVTSSTLNVMPPSGEVYSQGELDMSGQGLDLIAEVSTSTYADADDCESPDCIDVPIIDTDMCSHLGINIDDMANSADSPSPYNQDGGNTVGYAESDITAGDGDGVDWGDYCSDAVLDSTNKADHICNNEAKIILINNSDVACGDSGNSVGPAKITGGEGRGVLIVTGDLNLAGGLYWEGLIYVLGDFKASGTVNIYGDIMVAGTTDISGNLYIDGDDDIAMSVAAGIGAPIPLRWIRASR